MNRVWQELRAWLSPRWGGAEQAAAFLGKPLPSSVSWPHTLGSLLLVYILFQALTGVLLGFYYSPSPQGAYASMRYVRDELFLGRFIHKLHRFGAGFIMVTAFLHMSRAYFLAAYKSPRELLWLSGLLLGILLTLFAFTGQLLPYDQRGYWATVVGIQIASGAPMIGDSIRELLTGGYGDIGATTLSRFYIMHVSVLPLVLAGLVALHLGILQRTGSAGPLSGASGPTRPFFPGQAVKDVIVAAIGSLALFLTAGLMAVVDSGPADPAASNFVPRPEWFFLSHYQILKYLPGAWQIMGTFVLPNALLAALLLLPFIDRSQHRDFARRKLATASGVIVCVAIVGLTIQGIATGPTPESSDAAHAASGDPIERGGELFAVKQCANCHKVSGQGGEQGPDLSHVGGRLRSDYLPAWIRNPRQFKPTTEMPAFEGTQDELESIVEYLLSLE